MARKVINTLEALEESMTGKKAAKGKPAPAKKAAPKAAPAPKAAFRAHAMAYDEKTKKYGKCASEEFEDVTHVLSFVKKQVDAGQGDGLHEVVIHVR